MGTIRVFVPPKVYCTMQNPWLEIAAGILLPFFLAGYVDFHFKERTKRSLYAAGKKWSDMPRYLLHEHGWHWWITAIWIAGMLIEVLLLGLPWQLLFGGLLFYTEDIVYYLFTWLRFGGTHDSGSFLPHELPWLHGDIPLYKRLTGDTFPRRRFLRIYAVQWILLLTALALFPPS